MKKLNILVTVALLVAISLLSWQCSDAKQTHNDTTSVPEKEENEKAFTLISPFNENTNISIEPTLRFPDFGAMLDPHKYNDRVFLLSQDFPKEMPTKDAALEKILSIDFKTDWKAYALAVRDYILEGNGNPNNYQNSFYLEDNKVRNWYHVPWQHWGETGREGIHGLTREGPILKKMLGPNQVQTSFAYAVGFYNDFGGYTIGKVWPEVGPPQLDYLMEGNGFPEGTVVGKVLWTTLDASQASYLNNPISWDAYVYSKDLPNSPKKADKTAREVATVNLIQMDIMVRDERAKSTGGWVFGTFVYNGELDNDNRWKNLQPVGLMWGNDPSVTKSSNNPQPTKTIVNPDLIETKINEATTMPAMHLGWGSRLNGPVDNPNSSCMSCHSTAQYPGVSSILPMFNDPAVPVPPINSTASVQWMRWFRNVPCTTPFDEGKAISFDYSLQLQKSVENYIEYLNTTKDGKYFLQYWDSPHKVSRNLVSTKK